MRPHNKVAELAAIFGQEIGKPFQVIGEDKGKALIKFDVTYGIKRFDGTYWCDAEYFLPALIIGKVHVYEEKEQLTLF